MDSDDRTRRNGWIAAGLTLVVLLASLAYTGYLVWVGKLPPEGMSESTAQLFIDSYMEVLLSPLTLAVGVAFVALYYGFMKLQQAQIKRAELEHDSFESE